MSTEFASAGLTAGQLNAIVKKLGGHDMALRFLRDELSVSVSSPPHSWREKDGVIYFSVTSSGITGENWINWPEQFKGFDVGDSAKQVLRSPDFIPTSDVTTEFAVLRGCLFGDNDRTTSRIRAEADKHKFSKPNAEPACLICEKFTNKDIEAMGLRSIVVMHEPINDSDHRPLFLEVCSPFGRRSLDAYVFNPDHKWPRGYGFAFVVSQQVSPQS